MITLEIISAYLPHKLKGIFTDLPGEMSFELIGITIENEEEFELIKVRGCPGRYGGHSSEISNFKPILRPLSEFPIKHAAIAGYWTVKSLIAAILNQSVSVKTWNKLLSDHYNVFNLKENEYIRKG